MNEKRAIAALGALAQETRLALFRLLVTVGPAGLPAGVIAERLGVQPSSLSFHLAQLVHAGLITQRRLSPLDRVRRDERAVDLPHRKLLRARCRLRAGLRSGDRLQ
jgi:DNA-binding transcriptional ArsR family regulator